MIHRALIRAIPATFSDAITMRPRSEPIDIERARRQHEAYAEALRSAGLELVRLPADDALPDSCFVEDCAVVADGTALITRPGASSRRGETDAVRTALASSHRIATMSAPATLDGGDCMRVGRRIFVGRSQRTNDAGIARLRAVSEDGARDRRRRPHGVRARDLGDPQGGRRADLPLDPALTRA